MIKTGHNQRSEIIRKYHDAREKLESIPIGETEAYNMNIDNNGISIEFWNLKK
jgi:hypothetical protein